MATIRRAFTQIELLVVVALLAVLAAILLPALTGAQRAARDVQCASNIRQLCIGLLTYAGDWKGKFPPNIHWYDPPRPTKGNFWMDEERLGPYVPSGMFYEPNIGYRGRIGGVFVCPEDEGGARSYCMNLWASSVSYYAGNDRYGYCFGGPNVPEASKTILVAEVFSIYQSPHGYLALTTGLGGEADLSPGQRFGANGKYVHSWGRPGDPVRYTETPTMITYMNHRRPGDGGVGPEPKGRLNIGYCDGHVAMKRHTELVDWSTGKSRFDSLWSPNDYRHELVIGPLK